MRSGHAKHLPLACLLLVLFTGTHAPCLAYGEAHQAITRAAVQCLNNDGKPYQAALALQYVDEMERGSRDADNRFGVVFNIPLASISHFYNPRNGLGLYGNPVTAASKCASLYQRALRRWRANDRAGAMNALGGALHMVQDVTVPHHARNTPGARTHTSYEAAVDEASATYVGYQGMHGEYAVKPPAQWVRDNALASMAYWAYVDGRETPRSPRDDFAGAAKVLVPLAVRTSAGFLAMFFADVEAPAVVAEP